MKGTSKVERHLVNHIGISLKDIHIQIPIMNLEVLSAAIAVGFVIGKALVRIASLESNSSDG
jgi:hypothetical protein